MEEAEVALNRIGALINADDVLEETSASGYVELYKNVELLVKPGLAQEFTKPRDYTPEDFDGVAACAVKSLFLLKQLLLKFKNKIIVPRRQKDILVPILILCGTHNQNFPWSSEESIFLSAEVLKEILCYGGVSSLEDLLCSIGENQDCSLFKIILLTLRPELTKETWMNIPSTCQIFKWLLFQVKHPQLADYLPDILPPSLMFADHFVPRYKVLAVECLEHILDNVPPSELKMYGRADVVYDALFHLTYSKELEVVCVLYPCLLKLLKGQEGNMHKKLGPRKWGRYDDIYNHLIVSMEMEDTLALRREFSKILPEFIEAMGVTTSKHLKRTLRVLFDYLSVHDGLYETSKTNALKSLIAVIKHVWPRMEFHCRDIIKNIMVCLYDSETGDQASLDKNSLKEFHQLCDECLCLLEIACPGRFQELMSELRMLGDDFPGMKLLKHFDKQPHI